MFGKKKPALPSADGLNEFGKAFYYEANDRGKWKTLEAKCQLSAKGTIENLTLLIDNLPKIPSPDTIEWANKGLALTFAKSEKPKGLTLSLTNDGQISYKFDN